MHSAINPSSSLRRILRYLEWISIAITAFVHIIPGGTWRVSFEYYPHVFLSLFPFFVLSWIFPSNRPLWQKQLYLLVGVAWAIIPRFSGIFLDLPLYLYIAKSYFLLNRKHIILTVALTGIVDIMANIWALPAISQVHHWDMNLNSPGGVNFVVDSLISYLMVNTFTFTLCRVVIAEQKSRQRAEALANQVETLAATLERTRIARDIHDSLGHTLTSLDTRLSIAQKLRQINPDQAAQAVDTAKILALQCIEDVSRALQTMRQSDFDLNQALTSLMEQLRCNQSLQVRWEIDLPKLSLQTSHQIYCIVKEGVVNIQKHAHASSVLFQGRSTPEGIVLELQDDGRGIDMSIPHLGFGLQGMKERTQMLGGKLYINSSPGAGTHIRVILPL